MKSIKLFIGVLAVVTAIVMIPRPQFSKRTTWVENYKSVNAIDSMEFSNKMSVWVK
jgi:hypothetical protein